VQNQRGDSFYIKAHFTYDQTEKGEMSFKKCDVFHVVDTLHNGVVGSWQAFRMGKSYFYEFRERLYIAYKSAFDCTSQVPIQDV
jgi:hypothetical protein